MSTTPPPYTNITGISRTVMKDNAQVPLANYNGTARPGELVVNLLNNDVYIGNTSGNLTQIAQGTGLPAYINYFDFASESVTTFITDPAVYTKLNTDTTAGFSRNGLTATNNRVTNTSSNAKVVKLEAILSFIPATSDFINVSAAFFQNDTIISCSEQKALTGVALQNEITVLPFHCVTQLDPGDYVEVWINNLTDETAIKLDNINVIITEF